MPSGDLDDSAGRFEALAASERERLARVACRILGDAAQAEDVVQETLVEVWKRLDRVHPDRLKGYTYRAVRFNALKRRARRRTHVGLDVTGELAAPEADASEEPSLDPLELERAIEGLGEAQKAVLRMRYYVGLSFRQNGVTLTISTNTASSRCRYALNALRRALAARKPR